MDDRDPGSAEVVSKRHAQTSNIDYSTPVPIRDTRETLFSALRWFIPHSDGHQNLAVKLSKARKRQIGRSREWEITLNEEEARRLLDVIQQGLAMTSTAASGDYLVIRLDDLDEELTVDTEALAGRLSRVLNHPRVLAQLKAEDFGEELLDALGGAVRVRSLRLAVDELRRLLEEGVSDEKVYQGWCKRHGWAFGTAYADPDDTRRIALGDEVDFLLASTFNGLRDVSELKRPNHEVLRFDEDRRSFFWAPEVAKAIGQCHRYLDALHEAARNGLRDHPQIRAYHPRATVVVGRSDAWSPDWLEALHGLNGRLHGITVMTYDQLLAQAGRLLEILQEENDRDVSLPAPGGTISEHDKHEE
jgi:Domain of unknown function (DUF4263)